MKQLYTKRPEDRLDYDVDFSRWLAAGDAIASVETSISDGGVTIDEPATDFSATAVKVWLMGGTNGETVHVTVKIVTAQEREKEICFRLRIREGC